MLRVKEDTTLVIDLFGVPYTVKVPKGTPVRERRGGGYLFELLFKKSRLIYPATGLLLPEDPEATKGLMFFFNRSAFRLRPHPGMDSKCHLSKKFATSRVDSRFAFTPTRQ